MTIEERFLRDIDNWCNHRPLLYLALKETVAAGPVLEMGMGFGSTPYLHDFCEAEGRELFSYDSNGTWVEQFAYLRSANHRVEGVGREWERVHDENRGRRWSVALVDHAPAERRYIDVERLVHTADIIVIHDSEPEAKGYGMDNIWHLFKYRVDVTSPQAWASAVSNTMEITDWKGRLVGGYRIS